MKKRRRSLRSRTKAVLRGGTAATGAVSLATLGLTTCSGENGGGVVDPVPPPALECKDADHGQNLHATATLKDLALNVELYDFSHSYADFDTVAVTDVIGASLDSLEVRGQELQVSLTLDSLAVTEVKFTVAGTWTLKSGPCDFQRAFTVTISQGGITVTQREKRLPLDVPRDVHIELVDRDGLRVNLRAAMAGEGTPEWRATAGTLERVGRLGVTWELPPDPGYYQIEVSVDHGVQGIGFDALALEVS